MDHFRNLLIWALPASGKSETLTFLRGLSPEERRRLHLGNIVEIDDYPRVAAFFKDDDAREARGESRVHTRTQTYEEGGFLSPSTWNDLDAYLDQQFAGVLQQDPNLHATSTVLLECYRGGSITEGFPLGHG